MSKKAIFTEIKGIKCDHCDWKDLSVEFDPEYYMDRPCPECGAPLYTQEQHDQLMSVMNTIETLNKMLEGSDMEFEEGDEYIKLSATHDEKGMVSGFEIDK